MHICNTSDTLKICQNLLATDLSIYIVMSIHYDLWVLYMNVVMTCIYTMQLIVGLSIKMLHYHKLVFKGSINSQVNL